MSIEFYIPENEMIPTRLRLKVDGKDVYYERSMGCFGYDFEVFDATNEEAVELATQLGRLMESQSYDHGASWRIVSVGLVDQEERDHIAPIARVIFRLRDAG